MAVHKGWGGASATSCMHKLVLPNSVANVVVAKQDRLLCCISVCSLPGSLLALSTTMQNAKVGHTCSTLPGCPGSLPQQTSSQTSESPHPSPVQRQQYKGLLWSPCSGTVTNLHQLELGISSGGHIHRVFWPPAPGDHIQPHQSLYDGPKPKTTEPKTPPNPKPQNPDGSKAQYQPAPAVKLSLPQTFQP